MPLCLGPWLGSNGGGGGRKGTLAAYMGSDFKARLDHELVAFVLN